VKRGRGAETPYRFAPVVPAWKSDTSSRPARTRPRASCVATSGAAGRRGRALGNSAQRESLLSLSSRHGPAALSPKSAGRLERQIIDREIELVGRRFKVAPNRAQEKIATFAALNAPCRRGRSACLRRRRHRRRRRLKTNNLTRQPLDADA
jgi:hypothetical protein